MNLSALLICASMFLAAEPRPAVIVVVGAEGTAEYGRQFRQWAERWQQAAERGKAEFSPIGLAEAGPTNDLELLKQRLTQLARPGSEAVWLVLIGHGTFDGKTARFNLRGSDVTAAELAAWVKPIDRPMAIILCSSSSSPFLNELSGPNRIVITATRSGHEYNISRFGDYLSAAMANPEADLDKDEQTSLLEAFLLAAAGVREFYERDGRLITEHALIDDNGDRMGTPPDWFQGLRAVKSAKDGAAPDGLRASQWHLVKSRQEEQLPAEVRSRRDQLEQELARLRERKSKLPEAQYFEQLEPLLVELARLYEGASANETNTERPDRK